MVGMAAIVLPSPDVPDSPAPAREESVPLRMVIDSGPRLVVETQVDGGPVTMLVHGNAGFTVMLTHDALARINGTRVAKESDFGLAHDLSLSDLGRGSTVLGSLAVGSSQLDQVPCEVFQLPTVNWEGMLGTRWLAATGAVVDFGRMRLGFTPPPGPGIEMRQDPVSTRFQVEVSVGSAGPAATFDVSTAAETTIDIGFARAYGVELTEQIGVENGPAGAVVPYFTTVEPLDLYAGGLHLGSVSPQVYDTTGYMSGNRPTGAAVFGGYLGADLWLANGAVLDFGA